MSVIQRNKTLMFQREYIQAGAFLLLVMRQLLQETTPKFQC
jgi:hypothetical protein